MKPSIIGFLCFCGMFWGPWSGIGIWISVILLCLGAVSVVFFGGLIVPVEFVSSLHFLYSIIMSLSLALMALLSPQIYCILLHGICLTLPGTDTSVISNQSLYRVGKASGDVLQYLMIQESTEQ